jgi:hypothetical protein
VGSTFLTWLLGEPLGTRILSILSHLNQNNYNALDFKATDSFPFETKWKGVGCFKIKGIIVILIYIQIERILIQALAFDIYTHSAILVRVSRSSILEGGRDVEWEDVWVAEKAINPLCERDTSFCLFLNLTFERLF